MKQLTLREMRKRRGLTQVQLAAASGVTQTCISGIERGDVHDPNFSTVVKLATALRIDPLALKFSDDREPEPVA